MLFPGKLESSLFKARSSAILFHEPRLHGCDEGVDEKSLILIARIGMVRRNS